MDRNQEFNALLGEPLPDALDGSVRRAGAKHRKSKLGRWCGIPVASLGGIAAAFILLVNTSIPFARACGSIPFLKGFAAAVAFSPSLKAAVENNYVQVVGQEQTVNGVTMRVEYLIVDQKQVNIFFSLKSPDYSALWGDPAVLSADGNRPAGCSVSWSDADKDTGLQCVTIDFMDEHTPPALTLSCKARGSQSYTADEPMPAPSAVADEPTEWEEPPFVAEFSFDLRFDPSFTETGETLVLDAPLVLDGQRFTAETVEIYPSHLRLNLSSDPGNTAWLAGLDFYLEDEKDNRYEPISNGISATGSGKNSGLISYRLESSYFDRAEHLTIHITGATWLDVGREFVAVDIKNSKALSPMPEGVELLDVTRVGDRVKVRLAAQMGGEDGTVPVRTDSYSVSSWEYRDPDGGEHHFNSMSTTGGFRVNGEFDRPDGVPEGCFAEEFYLPDYPWDTVELGMYHSRYSTFERPIEISVK